MSTRKKLVISLSVLSLTVVTAIVSLIGIFSLLDTSFNVGGDINFSVTNDICATVSQATISGGSITDETKMQEIYIDAENDGAEAMETWNDVNLNFNENGDDVVINFTITNHSENNYLRFTIGELIGITTNATMSLAIPAGSADGTTATINMAIPANTETATDKVEFSKEIVITFSVIDKNKDASITGFNIPVSLTKITPNLPADWLTLSNAGTSYEITKGISTLPDHLIIPAYHNRLTVNNITANVFNFEDCLISVFIPNTISSIMTSAFSYCTNLTTVTIEKDSSIVSYLYASIFESCYNLTSITIPPRATSIPNGTFKGCKSLTNITIPSSVKSILDNAFYGCRSLTSITIPSSVKSILSNAFYGCYNLVEVYNLSDLTIESGADSNGYVGYYASVVKNSARDERRLITIDGVDYYKNSDTDYIALRLSDKTKTSITLDNNTTEVGRFAFYNCDSLASVALPSKLKTIGKDAFWYCTSLTSITIPSSVTQIGSSAFRNCTGLETINFDDTSTWYSTEYPISGYNQSRDVTNSATNVTHFVTTYVNHSWLKK